jgi:2-methylaconitate cis-trans-isomerase PrpF
MSRFMMGAAIAALMLTASVSAATAAQVDRGQLVEQMKQNCYSTHANDDPAIKGKCECYAKAFVSSLTQGEIAVPKPSAAINAKLQAARRSCHFGDV